MFIYLNRYRYSNNPASVDVVIQITFFPAFPRKGRKSGAERSCQGRSEAESGASLDNERSGAKMSVWGKGGDFFCRVNLLKLIRFLIFLKNLLGF